LESKEIRELIELISRSNFSTFELERDGFKIKLVKGGTGEADPVPREAPRQVAASGESGAATPAAGGADATAEAPAPEPGLYELHSPIVGTFYSAPGPGSANFVEVGSQVHKGQVLCIVEAMKVMNEIESEIDAEVVEIFVTNGQPVEYGELLFRLRPAASPA
jgi:acetyl-CoA carboxylase biotin carboxyl carrier protein